VDLHVHVQVQLSEKTFVLSFKIPGNRCFLYKFTLISKTSSKLAAYSLTSLTGFLSSVFHLFVSHLYVVIFVPYSVDEA
jgi:hypothetical protein